MRQFITAAVMGATVFFNASLAQANEKPFAQWLDGLKQEARQQGISQTTLNDALKGITPIKRVIELDRKQPESSMSFSKYLERIVNATRIKQGKKLYQQHKALLEQIGEQYGVQPRFIVALWGIETNYGSNTGGFKLVPALATLAYDGRRAEFFRDELLKALNILDQGHITLSDFKGSWAGAMGQSQFMPSSFLAYAQDYNGDGRKDIWNTLPDVFASIANYLKNTGWDSATTWGRKVRIPGNFDESVTGRDIKKPIAEWSQRGVTRLDGSPLPTTRGDEMASIIFPGMVEEGAYMTYGNYDRIMRWNRSTYFATAVGTLADKIIGR